MVVVVRGPARRLCGGSLAQRAPEESWARDVSSTVVEPLFAPGRARTGKEVFHKGWQVGSFFCSVQRGF